MSMIEDIRERARRVTWHDQDECKADRAHLLTVVADLSRALHELREVCAHGVLCTPRSERALEDARKALAKAGV